MENDIRVRFAPSPTGGLHLGGVRTALFNYLFARRNGGTFILRIEDTDQGRFVAGAEDYILQCLDWCGISPDESPARPGAFGPYRQSERKAIYRQYAEELVKKGMAYYAFDTAAALEQQRTATPNFQYNHDTRNRLDNSLTLGAAETAARVAAGNPHVVRLKMPAQEIISFTDMIRGEVSVDSAQVDDKVLLKADGMPTYHLAVVVDDYLMKITHAFRGEEWLPSAPVHVQLWKHLFGLDKMPQWAHLPLILKPDGHGKLSKRDGDRLGFPVFAMNWTDPKTLETTKGFRELGFLPEAFVNMLAMLGWNDGTEQEIFSLEELAAKFSVERIHKAGAKFDFEKAKWFNQEWIKKTDTEALLAPVKAILTEKGIAVADDNFLSTVIGLVKDRCHLLYDFVEQSAYFFTAPEHPALESVQPKWNDHKQQFFMELIRQMELMQQWDATDLEKEFKEMVAASQIKPGDVLLPLRVMLVGGKFGAGVFDIAAVLGKAACIQRIRHSLQLLQG